MPVLCKGKVNSNYASWVFPDVCCFVFVKFAPFPVFRQSFCIQANNLLPQNITLSKS